MKTFLAQNQFISNPSVTPEPPTERSTADSECRLQNVARPDATAERDPHPIPESALASAMTADTAAGPDLTDPPVPAAVLISSSCGSPSVEKSWPHGASLQQGAGTSSKPSTAALMSHGKGSDAASVANPQTDPEDADSHQSPHEAIPSNEGRPQETPASAPSKNPDAGVLADRIDWHEFFEAVMDERIVLFELYDEVPLFLRDGDHLRLWTA